MLVPGKKSQGAFGMEIPTQWAWGRVEFWVVLSLMVHKTLL